jgi:AraC-like DNA-binding protein
LYENFPHIFYWGEPFALLAAPSLFLFISSITRKNFRFKKEQMLHLIPFIAAWIVLFFLFYQYPAEIKRELILSQDLFPPLVRYTGMIILNVQVLGYTAAAVFLIYAYKKEIPQQQASVLPEQINWLYLVVAGICVIHFSGFIKYLVARYAGVFSELLYLVSVISTFAFVMIILYYIVRHPLMFSMVDTELSREMKKYSLSSDSFDAYKARLVAFMTRDKPYLDSELTLQKLAALASIPPHSLSEVINRGFNQSFFGFVNTYRVNEAKRLLAQSDPRKTILEILYEVGYGNKSVFNAVFKKYTGLTPTQYRVRKIGRDRPLPLID